MDLVSPLFIRKRANNDNLVNYGFIFDDGKYTKRIDVLNGDFYIQVTINNSKVDAHIFDSETLMEYNLIFIESTQGEFVGKVREAFTQALTDIANNCFDEVLFVTDQANRIARYIYKTYHVEPDFPWAKYDDYGVFRNKGNGLWFALMGNYFDKEKKEKVYFINLKVDPLLREELLKVNGVIPAYHMNKRSWITVYINDTVNDEFIESLIDYSYNSSVGMKRKHFNK